MFVCLLSVCLFVCLFVCFLFIGFFQQLKYSFSCPATSSISTYHSSDDELVYVFGEFKPEHKLPVFKSEFKVVILTAVVGVKQKPIGLPGLKLEADGAVQTSLPARVLHVRILGPVREKGGGGGDAEEEQEREEERRFEHVIFSCFGGKRERETHTRLIFLRDTRKISLHRKEEYVIRLRARLA